MSTVAFVQYIHYKKVDLRFCVRVERIKAHRKHRSLSWLIIVSLHPSQSQPKKNILGPKHEFDTTQSISQVSQNSPKFFGHTLR